jgi:hypothetical protein
MEGVSKLAKKYKSKSMSIPNLSSHHLLLAAAVAVGFIAGFYMARDRYMDKISIISQMNMEKANTIDGLKQQIMVLGASDSKDE